MLRSTIFLLVMLLLCAACKKDVDETPPVVIITAPGMGLQIIMPDTITVTASVSDEEQLTSVSFGLVDEGHNWLGERIYVNVDGTAGQFSQTLIIDDLDIEGGTHYLEVLASDGVNDEREFVEVQVIPIPRVYLGTGFRSTVGGMSTVSYMSAEGVALDFSTDAESLRMTADGRHNSVYAYLPSTQELVAYELGANEIRWSAGLALAAGEEVVNIYYDSQRKRIVLLTDAPRIIAYDRHGGAGNSFDLNAGYDVIDLAMSDSEYWLLSNSNGSHRVSLINKSSGFEITQYSLDFVPLTLALLGDEELVMTDNETGVHVLDITSGDRYQVPTVANGNIHTIVNDGTRAYMASESAVYSYEVGASQTQLLYSSSGITGLTWDNVAQRLIVAEPGALRFYGPSPWIFLGEQMVTGEVSGLQALFNK